MQNNKKEKYKRYSKPFIYIPILAFIALMFFDAKIGIFKNIKIDEIIASISTISITITGFLFTSLSILIALPVNNFTDVLRQTKYFRDIYIIFGVTIIVFLILSLIICFNYFNKIGLYVFIISVIETIVLACYLVQIGILTSKSSAKKSNK